MKNRIIFLVLGALCLAFVSCDKDNDDNDNNSDNIVTGNSVYVQIQGDKSQYYDLRSQNDTTIAIAVGYKNDITYSKPVSITHYTDLSLVSEYNSLNGTNYLPFPEESIWVQASVSIPANVSFANLNVTVKSSALEIGEVYVLPITLRTVIPSNTDVVVDKDYSTVYIVFSTELIPEVGDTELNKNLWTIADFSSQWNTTDYAATNVLDNDVSTYWHSVALHPTLSVLPQWLSIDMHGKKQISEFTLVNRQDNPNPKSLQFEVSKDNVVWKTVLVVTDLPQVTTLQTLPLPQPVVCRYFKVTVNSTWDGADWTFFAELSAN
jgi:hypothetical protein